MIASGSLFHRLLDSMQLVLGGHCEFDVGGLHAADQFYGCVVVVGYCLREACEQYNTSSIVYFYWLSASSCTSSCTGSCTSSCTSRLIGRSPCLPHQVGKWRFVLVLPKKPLKVGTRDVKQEVAVLSLPLYRAAKKKHKTHRAQQV